MSEECLTTYVSSTTFLHLPARETKHQPQKYDRHRNHITHISPPSSQRTSAFHFIKFKNHTKTIHLLQEYGAGSHEFHVIAISCDHGIRPDGRRSTPFAYFFHHDEQTATTTIESITGTIATRYDVGILTRTESYVDVSGTFKCKCIDALFFVIPSYTTLTFFLKYEYLQDDESRCSLAYSLSFSNDESDFQRNFTQLDSIMKTQLRYNQQFFQSSSSMRNRRRATDPRKVACQQQHPPKQQPIDTEPLPRTLQDALRPSKTRSIVITEKEAPFRIVNVNACWEQLCGYSYVESKGKTLGSLLRGPQTDPLTATTIISKLLHGENDVGATLVNYKKNGQPFYNRIRAGPIYNEETGEISHFVGLLQEIGSELEHVYGNHSVTQQHMYA